MTVKQINSQIQATSFQWERWHDFRGNHDRWRENHNVLTHKTKNIKLIARNARRTKWNVVSITNNQVIILATDISLKEALQYENPVVT